MNKKVLLSTLLASGIVATSLLTGNVKGTTNIENYGEKVMTAVQKVEQTETKKSDYIMSVLLESANPLGENKNILTRKQVENLLNEKYGKIGTKSILSKVYGKDGSTEIKEENAPVGTGYTVELATGRKMKVVLYGDVNKDGMIDTNDTVEIAKHNVHTATLDDYQKLAAQLKSKEEESKETIDGINTDDTVRVAYYNVNGLTTDKTGKAIVDMELYPEDLVETANIDDIMQASIDDINNAEGENARFSMTLDKENNNIQFGFLNDVDVQLTADEGNGVMLKLANNLKTHKDNLEKIELTVKNNTITLTPDMLDGLTEKGCLYQIASLFAGKTINDENAEAEMPTVASILGEDVKIKVYFYQTTKLEEETAKQTSDKGYFVEYTVKLLADAEQDVVNMINGLKENEWFDTTIDGHEITVTVNSAKLHTKFINSIVPGTEDYIVGQGKTGIIDAMREFLNSPYIEDFGKVTVTSNIEVGDDTTNKSNQISEFTFKELKEALSLVKQAVGILMKQPQDQSNTIDELIKKEEKRSLINKGIIFVNTFLGRTDTNSTLKNNMDQEQWKTALTSEIGLLANAELSDLFSNDAGKELTLTFELGENIKDKTNWNDVDSKTYKVKFAKGPAEITNKDDLEKVLKDKTVKDIKISQDAITDTTALTVEADGATIEGIANEDGTYPTLKANLKINATNVTLKNLTIEDPDYSAPAAAAMVMSASDTTGKDDVMVISKSNVTLENVTFKNLKSSDTNEKGTTNSDSIINIKENADNITIKNCTFEGNTATANTTNGVFRNIILINKDAGSNITITGNTFKQLGSVYNGIEFAFDYEIKSDSKLVIENNTFTSDIKHNSLSMYKFAEGANVTIKNNILAGVRFSNNNGGNATINFEGGQILVGEENNGPVTFQRTSENDKIENLTVNVKGLKDKDGNLFSSENNKFAGLYDDKSDGHNIENGKKPTINYIS